MTKKLLGAAAALALAAVASSPAYAANISLLGGTVNGSGFGNSIVYNTVIGGQAISLKVTAWSINTASTPKITAAKVVQYSGGLGITNNNGNADIGSPQHAIDNNGWDDFLLLQFSTPVDLNGFHIGWEDVDTDATVRYGNVNGAFPNINNMTQTDFNNLLANSVQVPGGDSIGNRTIPVPGEFNTWTIGASTILDMTTCSRYDKYCKPKPLYDYFKVDSLKVSNAVPEPGTWMMMILGIGAVGGAMRRRQKATVRFNMAAA
ncbi:MAG TPA: PEPxxWA-CTERM sorting domain-containing protein [Novosphingobium sp.]